MSYLQILLFSVKASLSLGIPEGVLEVKAIRTPRKDCVHAVSQPHSVYLTSAQSDYVKCLAIKKRTKTKHPEAEPERFAESGALAGKGHYILLFGSFGSLSLRTFASIH